MKKSSTSRRWTWCAVAAICCAPRVAFACGMSAIGAGGGLLVNAMIGLAGVLFLAGYLPYLGLSARLFVDKRNGQPSKGWVRVGGLAFTILNTTVFLSAVWFVATAGSGWLFAADLLLWGVPFVLFVRGFAQAASEVLPPASEV